MGTRRKDPRAARRHRDHGNDDQRSRFEQDRDRILYSSAFHRLSGITQVVRAGEAGFFHTRQQHTIKVAQIGRRLAQNLCRAQSALTRQEGIDPEVVEAACMAHDLGHPPFGHIGEETLDELVAPTDGDGFEGNAQSFRILTKLAVRFDTVDGMDLTRATLAATLKYPWFRNSAGKKSMSKFSAYKSEAEDFEFARSIAKSPEKTAEAELMDWSDDVAYSVHDLEDFHRGSAIPWRRIFEDEPDVLVAQALEAWKGAPHDAKTRLENAFERLFGTIWGSFSYLLLEPYNGGRDQREQLRRMTSWLIGKYIQSVTLNPDLTAATRVIFVEDDVDEVRLLKQITRDYIIDNPTLRAQQRGQQLVVTQLFEALMDGAKKGMPPFLPMRLRYLHSLAEGSTARFAADCIASLSEEEAIGLHGRLYGTATGSVLDPIVR